MCLSYLYRTVFCYNLVKLTGVIKWHIYQTKSPFFGHRGLNILNCQTTVPNSYSHNTTVAAIDKRVQRTEMSVCPALNFNRYDVRSFLPNKIQLCRRTLFVPYLKILMFAVMSVKYHPQFLRHNMLR